MLTGRTTPQHIAAKYHHDDGDNERSTGVSQPVKISIFQLQIFQHSAAIMEELFSPSRFSVLRTAAINKPTQMSKPVSLTSTCHP